MQSARETSPVRKLIRAVFILLLVGAAVLMVVPFIWMLSASFKMQKDVMTVPIQWIPDYFYPDNYKRVLHLGNITSKDYHFFNAYWNSIKVACVSTLGAITSAAMAGYAFAKLKFKGANVIFLVYLAQMMVPTQLTLIPRFVLFTQWNMTGSHLPIILPRIIAVSAIFLMRQAFLSMPNELRESAMLDGAGEFRIWWEVGLPMVKPTLGALATVQFLESWNSYLDPLVFLPNWQLHTLPIALNQFVSEEVSQYNLVMAACSLTVIPVFAVFLAGQKFFIKGLTVGAVKG